MIRKSMFFRCLSLAMALTLAMTGLAVPAAAEEEMPLPTWYSSAEFEEQFTYTGNDLGASWSADSTAFRVWAPTATAVKVNLYESGTAGTDDLMEQVEMTPDVNGTWVAVKEGNLNGVYYTYQVEVDGVSNEACDPYARTTGVNGQRAMVIDMASTNPEGWDADENPHYNAAVTDIVLYELHVRDLSSDASSGIQNIGKFLGLIESGTVNSQGISTGLDHMKKLGITHLHLLPSYDYASIDETKLEENNFNWGYDPVNYNVPEGSYATDPYKGEVRVREMKQMVKGLHDNGIAVVMDVVYNHVSNADTFCFNKIVPGYFSRITSSGMYSNGSYCGNDTASERAMVRKYIVDSVKYWADEYHIDGFRFDLAGLIDTQTINEVIAEVSKTHPDVVFYGEGWTMNTLVTKENVTMTTQANSTQTPGFAFFSDTLRDSLRGPISNNRENGYLAGKGGYTSAIRDAFMGKATWCKSPTQTINYASCHDNMTLYDRLTMSCPDATVEDRIRMNNLAAAIYMTAQGIPFIHAGEEMLRSKPMWNGEYDHNSYKSSDKVNSLKWDNLNDPVYQDVVDYYAGLIAFRKAHPALRMTDAAEIQEHITSIGGVDFNVVACHISEGANGEENGIVAIFNPRSSETVVTLPEGEWTIYINDQDAGTEALGSAQGKVTVAPISAMVLVKEVAPAVQEPAASSDSFADMIPVILGALTATVVATFLMNRKMKKMKKEQED